MGYGKCKFVIHCTNPYRTLTYCEIHTILMEMHTHYGWSYQVFSDEVCPTTGSLHVDGYYEQPTQRKFPTENKKFLKYFGSGYGDLQMARGTAGENFDYTEKEGRYLFTQGEPARSGQKTSLQEASAAIMIGETTVDQLCIDSPELYHQYGRTLTKLEDLYLRRQFRTEMPEVTWLYGASGIGKSHQAYQGYCPATSYNWKDDNGWQDGYCGQKHIIMNEFRGEEQIKFHELLKICDKWPYEVRRRNREPVPLLATSIVITSNVEPKYLYGIKYADLGQLYRRINLVKVEA